MSKYIIALDQGTTSSRAVLLDEKGAIQAITQQEFSQIFPRSGWVEHDPREILSTQLGMLAKLLSENKISASSVAAIGITNQRETTVVWDKKTGEPIYNAIVWQDKRTAPLCEQLKSKGLEEYVRENTGLVIDSYFSGTKINWILNHVEGARSRAEKGELLFGTIDTWLIWNMTKGKSHVTDYSNASRTLLYNIRNLEWDKKLMEELDVPSTMLPKVMASSADFGHYELDGVAIPIAG
ncbi:MAG: FGGY family carbohydrate kinase, partial [Cyclobacteriaceae bacterium]